MIPVTEMALAVLFDPACAHVFPATLSRLVLPRGRHFTLIDALPLLPTHGLPGNRHKTRVDDLPTPGGVAGFPQQSMDVREQSLRQFGLGLKGTSATASSKASQSPAVRQIQGTGIPDPKKLHQHGLSHPGQAGLPVTHLKYRGA